jgi:uncharacterized protein (TIGR02118 family)
LNKTHCVTIMYPNRTGARFDFDYYLTKHIPMWNQFQGVNKIEVRRGVATHNGLPVPVICSIRIQLDTPIDEFMTRFKNEAHHILEDIPNYTNVEPVIQFDEVLLIPKS